MNEKQDVKKYFDDVSNDYLKYKYEIGKRSFMSVRQEKMIYFLDRYCQNNSRKVLDAGCGPGLFLIELLKKGHDVTGVDISMNMLKLASTQITKMKLTGKADFLMSTIEDMPFSDNSFDMITSAGVIEYLDSDNKVLQEFKRILKKDGYFLISVTNKYSYNLIFDNIIEIFRRNSCCFSLMNYFSEKIIGSGTIQPKEFHIRKHSPSVFRNKLIKSNFLIVDSLYFYFMPFPHPFNLLFSRFNDKLGTMLEKLGKTKLGFLGEGYLLICKNVK